MSIQYSGTVKIVDAQTGADVPGVLVLEEMPDGEVRELKAKWERLFKGSDNVVTVTILEHEE